MSSAPVAVSSANTQADALFDKTNIDSAGNMTGYTPYSLVYSTVGASGGDHMYLLKLDASMAPQPVQISSAILPGTTGICSWRSLHGNMLQPDSGIMIYVTPGGDMVCGTADDVSALVHVTDSATTAPAASGVDAAAISQLNFIPFYNGDGSFAGALSVDAKGNLNLFKTTALDNPTTLLKNAAAIRAQYQGAGYVFFSVRYDDGVVDLFRMDGSGQLSVVPQYEYQGVPAFYSGAVSGGYLYLTDLYFSTGTTAPGAPGPLYNCFYNIARVKLDGSAVARVLLSGSCGQTYEISGPPQFSGDGPQVYVVGLIGSTAVAAVDLNSGTSTLIAFDTSGSNFSPTTILSAPDSYFLNVIVTNDKIFVAYYDTRPLSGAPPPTTTEVLQVDGSVIQRFVNTDIPGFGFRYSAQAGTPYPPQSTVSTVYLAQNITSGSLVDDGATLEALAPDTLAINPILDGLTGQPYVLDKNQFFVGLSNSGTSASVVTDYADVGTPATGEQVDAMGLDAINNLLYRLTQTDDTDEIPVTY